MLILNTFHTHIILNLHHYTLRFQNSPKAQLIRVVHRFTVMVPFVSFQLTAATYLGSVGRLL